MHALIERHTGALRHTDTKVLSTSARAVVHAWGEEFSRKRQRRTEQEGFEPRVIQKGAHDIGVN